MMILFCLALQLIITHSQQTLVTHRIVISTQQHPLPISIDNLVSQTSINKIVVKMGHLTNNHTFLKYPRGINAHIYNSTQLVASHLSQIKSLLMISQDDRFQIYLPQLKMLLIADPNDRLCTEQLQHLLRYFYPCRNYAHLKLQKLINPSKLLEQYLSVQFIWNIEHSSIQIEITLPRQKSAIESTNKYTSCGHISIYQTNIEGHHQSNYQNLVQYKGETISKWYNPKKLIRHTFTATNILINSTIKLITLLPNAFVYQSFNTYPNDLPFTLIKYINSQGLYLQFTLVLPPFDQQKQFTVNINFHSSLPPFQYFQTIAGGGEQLLNVPLFLYNETVYQLHSKIISQRLLEPDFSIPFQTITFTIGIVGYLWINLWRIHKTGQDSQTLSKKKCI